MVIELLKAWHGWKTGKRFSAMPEGAARLLIKRGIAKEIKPRKRRPKKAS